MHRWTENDGYVSAQLVGPSMQAEVTQHFGLIYLVAVQPDASVELRQQIMRGLRATAVGRAIGVIRCRPIGTFENAEPV
jgi:hypothetical protein